MAGTLTISTLSDGTNSTSATNCIQGSAKAWVTFSNTPAILASYNVSSITNNSTGLYTVSFTNAMVDANYTVTQGHGWNGARDWGVNTASTTNVQIAIGYVSNTSGGGTGANAQWNTNIVIHR